MSKQEEIRKGILATISEYCGNSDPIQNSCLCNELVARLHGLWGVVIKVKCPDCQWSQFKEEEVVVGMTPCHSCDSTGYITESLIE